MNRIGLFLMKTMYKSLYFVRKLFCLAYLWVEMDLFLDKATILFSVVSNSYYVMLKCIQQIDVSFSCVCPAVDHEFRHNIAKAAMDRLVDPQTTLTML